MQMYWLVLLQLLEYLLQRFFNGNGPVAVGAISSVVGIASLTAVAVGVVAMAKRQYRLKNSSTSSSVSSLIVSPAVHARLVSPFICV